MEGDCEEIPRKGRGEQLRVKEWKKIAIDGDVSLVEHNKLSDVAPTHQGTKAEEE